MCFFHKKSPNSEVLGLFCIKVKNNLSFMSLVVPHYESIPKDKNNYQTPNFFI